MRTIRSAAEPLVAAGLAAHGAAVALTASSGQRPLLAALVTTLVFAGISLAYGRRPGAVVGLAPGRLWVRLAALWIAPFYGLFSAPLFLGISLNTMCLGRPIVTAALAALGMRVGEQPGLAVVGWIYSAPPRRDT